MGDAGDAGDYDPCECVLSQEWATRRLINMIRQSQDYCTENECYTETAGDNSDPTGSTAMFFMGFWFLLAVVLFFLRPRTSVPGSKSFGGSGPNLDPPPPTATWTGSWIQIYLTTRTTALLALLNAKWLGCQTPFLLHKVFICFTTKIRFHWSSHQNLNKFFRYQNCYFQKIQFFAPLAVNFGLQLLCHRSVHHAIVLILLIEKNCSIMVNWLILVVFISFYA